MEGVVLPTTSIGKDEKRKFAGKHLQDMRTEIIGGP